MSLSECDITLRKKILALFANELDLQEKHLHLLCLQKVALIACDREEFARLHDEHEDLLTEIELQNADCKRCLPSGSQLKSEIEGWPSPDRDEAHQMVLKMRGLTNEIERQRAQNQVLISNDLKLINFQLNLVVAAMSKGFQYVSTGQSMPVQSNRLINRTA